VPGILPAYEGVLPALLHGLLSANNAIVAYLLYITLRCTILHLHMSIVYCAVPGKLLAWECALLLLQGLQ
jgi:hypothetical protein